MHYQKRYIFDGQFYVRFKSPSSSGASRKRLLLLLTTLSMNAHSAVDKNLSEAIQKITGYASPAIFVIKDGQRSENRENDDLHTYCIYGSQKYSVGAVLNNKTCTRLPGKESSDISPPEWK